MNNDLNNVSYAFDDPYFEYHPYYAPYYRPYFPPYYPPYYCPYTLGWGYNPMTWFGGVAY